MKQICPCCKKEFSPPPPATTLSDGLDDMADLFSCDYCGSVLKWESGKLKVVHEAKEDFLSPAPPVDTPDTFSSPEDNPSEIHQEAEDLEKPPSENNFFPEEEEGKTGLEKEDLEEGKEGKEGLVEEKDNLAEGSDQFVPSKEETEDHNPPEDFLSATSNLEGEESSTEEASSVESDDRVDREHKPDPSASAKEVLEEWKEEGELSAKEDQWDSPQASPQEVNQDFSDVEKYGNARASSEKGFLRYDLCISGLDSLEIEQEVLSVLEDPRFKWDAREILASQKEGVLEIKNLNPVKAMCLVSELSFLSVELSWKQQMALNVREEEQSQSAEEEHPEEK